MRYKPFTVFLSLFMMFVAAGCAKVSESLPAHLAVPNTFKCPVTGQGLYGNDGLQVVLNEPGSKFVFSPGGAGFVDRDGALGMKVAWQRLKKGYLQISGRRLDGPAAPARAYIYDYGDSGGQPTYLVFPTPGCWEITGRVADSSLTFVTLVEKVGDGPPWKFAGLESGWRISK